MEYDVFISHSSKDKQAVKLFAEELEGQGFIVWYDTNEIDPGEDWPKEIEIGIDNSKVVVVWWTENAEQSEWVQREITRAEKNKTPIIPFLIDDTPVSIPLERTQHIDGRSRYSKGLPELVTHLQKFIEADQDRLEKANLLWKPAKVPFFRSRFLEQNNYLERKSSNFAVNTATQRLFDVREDIPAASFVSFVIAPILGDLDVDLDTVIERLELNKSPLIFRSEPVHYEWQHFTMDGLRKRITDQSSFIRYEAIKYADKVSSYVRFDEDGNIEVADAYYHIGWFDRERNFTGYAFRFALILGTAWKLITLAEKVYELLEYTGKYQLIINMKNTQAATLIGFAGNSSRGGSHHWPNRLAPGTLLGFRDTNSSFGLASDPNLQFVYDIETQAFTQNPELSEALIEDLSKKLQRSFNYGFAPRHYYPNTEEFPWQEYNMQLKW